MRIGTWNVEYAPEGRLDVLRRVMSLHTADIWVLTETHDVLAPSGAVHAAHSDPRPRQRDGSRWVSIWSRYPIVEQVVCKDARRTMCAVIDTPEVGSLVLYGTVMPWHTDQGDDPPPDILPNWTEHDRVVALQCEEWRGLCKRFPGSFCVAGDFNTDMGSGARYGTKRGIATITQAMDECDLFCATAPGRVPDGRLTMLPIDHIVLPSAWAQSTSVVAAWPAFKGVVSDHSGLIVEVKPSSRPS
ncbi:MAG: endonuclease/exonuclease/phosphatase family protein [Hyphomonadaceae bacterium]